jgi:hypothetical protein
MPDPESARRRRVGSNAVTVLTVKVTPASRVVRFAHEP